MDNSKLNIQNLTFHFTFLLKEIEEIINILTAIVKTSQQNIVKNG